MINSHFKFFLICSHLFLFFIVEAQKGKLVEFQLSELNIINGKDSFFKEIDSLILSSDCPKLNKTRSNYYSIDIAQKEDSNFSVKVTLATNPQDTISNMGFFKENASIFIVRGINPDNLFFISKKKRTLYGKKRVAKSPRELITGPPPVWSFEYNNRKLKLVEISNCVKPPRDEDDE